MDKARELLDRFFCIPNIAFYVFIVVMLSLCVGLVAFGAVTSKPLMPAACSPRNLPEGNTLLQR